MSRSCDCVRSTELPVGSTLSPTGNFFPIRTISPFQKDEPFSMPNGQVREHLLAALLELPEDAILSASLDGTIDIWSRGAELIYGYTAQEITGQPMSRLVPLHEWPGLRSVFSDAH